MFGIYYGVHETCTFKNLIKIKNLIFYFIIPKTCKRVFADIMEKGLYINLRETCKSTYPWNPVNAQQNKHE